MNNSIKKIREFMNEQGINYLLVNSTNKYLEEYTSLEENSRYFLTGFSGSTGDVLVAPDNIFLFVDGRYHIQADLEVNHDVVTVVKLQTGQVFLDELIMKIPENESLGVFSKKNSQKRVEYLQEKGVNISLVEAWAKGGEGAIDLAGKIVDLCEKPANFKYCYELNDTIKEKIEKIATKIYGAEGVEYSDEAEKIIQDLEKNGYGNMPVCIAKTQYSFSDDAKNLLCLEPFKIHVKNVILKTGAGFIVILTGNIFTMPGLPKVPAAEKIDIDENGNIVGIF